MMGTLCISAALNSEVQAIAEHYSLMKTAHKGISLYTNQDQSLMLVKTGIGKSATVSTLSETSKLVPDINAFLNIGIAGGLFPRGSVVLAGSIEDVAESRRHFPHLPPASVTRHLLHANVQTLEKPSDKYTKDVMFDMECSAFYEFTSTMVDNSKIQAIKVISDNPQQPLTDITPELVKRMVLDAQENIAPMVQYLISLDKFDDRHLEIFCANTYANIHHSVTEQHRFKRLCQRYCTLAESPTNQLKDLDIKMCNSAAELAHQLQVKIDNFPIHYS